MINFKYSESLFVRESHQVKLVTTLLIMDSVKELLNPYIIQSYKDESSDNNWTLTTFKKISGLNGYKEIVYSPLGEPSCRFFLNGDRKQIFLEEVASNSEWLIQLIVRLIRKIIRLEFYEDNHLFLHGGLVGLEEKGIGVLGAKKAGKTSTILSLLKEFKVSSFVTNDDISLKTKEGSWIGYGWPRSISIRNDTILKLFDNDHLNKNLILKHPLNYSELESKVEDITCLYPFELSKLVDRNIKDSIDVKILVFPEFTGNNTIKAKVEQLSIDEGAEQIIKNIELNPGKYNEYLLPFFKLPSPSIVQNIAYELAKQVSCIKLSQSFDSLSEGSKILKNFIR